MWNDALESDDSGKTLDSTGVAVPPGRCTPQKVVTLVFANRFGRAPRLFQVPYLHENRCVVLYTYLVAPGLGAGGRIAVFDPPSVLLAALLSRMPSGRWRVSRLTVAGWALWMAGRWLDLPAKHREIPTQ